MSRWKIYTPEGVQDILFDQCYMKRNIESVVRRVFSRNAYLEVETPSLEFYDVFSGEGYKTSLETMFKFFDQQGRILVLRPEMTIPVVRIAATKLKDAVYPLKVFYIGNAFNYNESGGGKQKEFTQAGVEILGSATPEADAEVIATAIQAVRETGLESFQIDIGQVEFFKGIMEETGFNEKQMEQFRELTDRKDYLGIEEMVKSQNVREDLKELLLSLPGMFGSRDVIERVEKITKNERSLAALSNLRQVLDLIEDYGLGKYVSIDLGMVQSLNYYTGIIFRGFTHGVGFPILSGGRYDTLASDFGMDCPATGFSLGINMLMMALDRQKAWVGKPETDSIVYYSPKGRKVAFSICQELRRQGLTIEIDISRAGLEAVLKYAAKRQIGGVINVIDENTIEIHDISTGEIKRTTIDELLRM